MSAPAALTPLFYFSLPISVSFASLVASVALLRWVWNLEERDAEKLLHRQLWHLALADIGYNLSQVPCYGNRILESWNVNPDVMNFICGSSVYGGNIFIMSSVAVEVHIAIATMFKFCHVRSYSCLPRYLPLVWIFGLISGSIIGFEVKSHYETDKGRCDGKDHGDKIKVVILIAVVSLCAMVYVWSLMLACKQASQAVQHRMETSASVFILIAIVAWGPFVIFTIVNPGDHIIGNSDNWYVIANSFVKAKGLLNALAYLFRSRRFRQQRRELSEELSKPDSLDPESVQPRYPRGQSLLSALSAISGPPSASGPPPLQTRQHQDSHSLTVGFDFADNVFAVAKVTEAALVTAESETRDLEISRGTELLRQHLSSQTASVATDAGLSVFSDDLSDVSSKFDFRFSRASDAY